MLCCLRVLNDHQTLFYWRAYVSLRNYKYTFPSRAQVLQLLANPFHVQYSPRFFELGASANEMMSKWCYLFDDRWLNAVSIPRPTGHRQSVIHLVITNDGATQFHQTSSTGAHPLYPARVQAFAKNWLVHLVVLLFDGRRNKERSISFLMSHYLSVLHQL